MLWRRPRYRKTLLCSRQVQEPRRIVVPKKMRYLKQLCANLENRSDRKTIKSVLTLRHLLSEPGSREQEVTGSKNLY